METEFKQLQLFYAAALADSVKHYNNAGILESVTEEKNRRQLLTAPAQLLQLGISTPKELFQHLADVFGCIQWQTEEDDNGMTARGKKCMLCSIAKSMQTVKPCYVYCINPVKAMLAAMQPPFSLTVEKTLWDQEECVFHVEQ